MDLKEPECSDFLLKSRLVLGVVVLQNIFSILKVRKKTMKCIFLPVTTLHPRS
jgi:hypothetical protein